MKIIYFVGGCLASAITGFIVGRHLPKKADLTVDDLVEVIRMQISALD